MTPTRYFIARLAQAFGYYQKGQRMNDAAGEMQLLREAETQLGAEIWENVSNIEALSVEYWNLRKLVKVRDGIQSKLEVCLAKLAEVHQERDHLLKSVPDENLKLIEERAALLKQLEDLAIRRDRIIAEARDVRRRYTGLETKLQVLTHEAGESSLKQEDMDGIKARFAELKTRFAELKQKRIEVGLEIDAGDARIELVEKQMKEKQGERLMMASEAFQVIAEANKEISVLRAEGGVIDTQMRQLYGEIGRYVSRNTRADPACAAAAAKHQGLVDVMGALRRSILLNHRLAERV